jgi:hypothetical protein
MALFAGAAIILIIDAIMAAVFLFSFLLSGLAEHGFRAIRGP